MTDPSNPDAPTWLQDIETTKALVSHPSIGNNRFATRCLEVVNRLIGSPAQALSGQPGPGGPHQQQHPHQQPLPQQAQQNFMPSFPQQLFSDPGFPGTLFPVEQQMPIPPPGGMDFSEWVNFPPTE